MDRTPNFFERHARKLGIARSEDDPTPVRIPAPTVAFVATAVCLVHSPFMFHARSSLMVSTS